jgi:eukaryotic-like serine/threonine-protein kinase
MTTPAVQFCEQCGNRKSTNARFCEKCGAESSPSGFTNFTRVRELFNEAVALNPARREAFIQEACGGNAELLVDLREMLDAAAQQAPSIRRPTETASSVPSTPAAFAAAGGESIGAYRLLRELGRGGMGVVHLAVRDDGAFRKNVAIKLLLREQVNSEFVLRFKQERQVVAALDHPNIARILDGGDAPGGMPYYVMEYVEGLHIDKYCDEQRLSLTGRLKIFQQVCHAVHYLHQNSIVHRDLKPSNILISSDGIVKLLDFGIAKVVGAASMSSQDLTSVQGRPMTPIYASPEQMAGGTLQKASDIYSLGVILYRLLTGRSPYESLDEKVAKLAAREDPPRPSANIREDLRAKPESTAQLRRAMMGGLDSIILMAMRYDPKKRYQSAADLAMDLERFIEGHSVVAHHDTVAVRSMKLLRRKRVAAAVLASFLVVGAFGAWQSRRVETQKAEAAAREAKLHSLLDQLEARLVARSPSSATAPSEVPANAASMRPVSEQIQDIRNLKKAFEPDLATVVARRTGHSQELDALLDRGIRYLDKVRASAPADPELNAEVGNTYERLGLLEESVPGANAASRQAALRTYEKAAAMQEAVLNARADDTIARGRLMAVNGRIKDLGGRPGGVPSLAPGDPGTPLKPPAAIALKNPPLSRPVPVAENARFVQRVPEDPPPAVGAKQPAMSRELEDRLEVVEAKVQNAAAAIEPIRQSLLSEGQTLSPNIASAVNQMLSSLERARHEMAAGDASGAAESLASADSSAARVLRSVSR